MMSVAPIASAGEAAGYYSNSDNYYFLGNLHAEWLGEGAKELGLEGRVNGDVLTSILEGKLPDGTRLGRVVNGEHVHRPGHDLTFSAPKSVSLLVLIGGDKRLLEAHNNAVKVAAGYVETLISARDTKNGVTSIVPTGKMVAALFTHDTNRNLDPQLHTHMLVANMTELAGKWKALATDYIHNAGFIETVMSMQVALGKIYRSALREQVEQLGHSIEIVGKHDLWEISGIPEDVRDEFSSRGKEIEAAVGAEATLRSRDVAAKDTRRAKVDPSRLRLQERWIRQMKEHGFDIHEYMDSVEPKPAELYSDIEPPNSQPEAAKGLNSAEREREMDEKARQQSPAAEEMSLAGEPGRTAGEYEKDADTVKSTDAVSPPVAEKGLQLAEHGMAEKPGRQSPAVEEQSLADEPGRTAGEYEKDTDTVKNAGTPNELPSKLPPSVADNLREDMPALDMIDLLSKGLTSPVHREVARRVGEVVRENKMNLSVDITGEHNGLAKESEVKAFIGSWGAVGKYLRFKAEDGSYEHKVYVYGESKAGENPEETIVHELVHAVTALAIRDKSPSPALAKAQKEIIDLYQSVKEAVASGKYGNVYEQTDWENRTGQKEHWLTNASEFVAFAMTSPTAQEVLAKIEVIPKKSAGSRFVDTVAGMLGIKSSDNTAFGEALRITDNIMSEFARGNADAQVQPAPVATSNERVLEKPAQNALTNEGKAQESEKPAAVTGNLREDMPVLEVSDLPSEGLTSPVPRDVPRRVGEVSQPVRHLEEKGLQLAVRDMAEKAEQQLPVAEKALQTMEEPVNPEVFSLVRQAVSQLSDSKTRFTWGELMLSTVGLGDAPPDIAEVKHAINAAMKEGVIVPLDREKGVFTSQIHLLDELSIQSITKELVNSSALKFKSPTQPTPGHLLPVEKDAIVLFNAPAGISGIRNLTEEVVSLAGSYGRQVQVLASSVERAKSLTRSDLLRDKMISKTQLMTGVAGLKPQGTLIIEGAEKLGLKETLFIVGEAREKGTQLVFLDSAARQSNGNAMSVLASAGVERSKLTQPTQGLEAQVFSIPDKRERYEALSSRFAELSAGTEQVTAVVVGRREQRNLTAQIREALQNAGQLEREAVTVESREPVYLDNKTRKLPSSYLPGQVLEDRSDYRDVRSYIIDRVHEDTRYLSLIDSDGVVVRQKIADMTPDWRLFNRDEIEVGVGEKLLAIAGDKGHGLKAKDRLTVTGIGKKGITVTREGENKPFTLPVNAPLYMTHAYVASPGSRDNDSGVVLAALNARDISTQMMNALSHSGNTAEIFTGDQQDKAEGKLTRMRNNSSPVQLVTKLSGKDDVSTAMGTLQGNVLSDAKLAVERAVADQREVSFAPIKLTKDALEFLNDATAIKQEIDAQIKSGDLISTVVGGKTRLVHRITYEMEKTIIRIVDEGKNTQQPLLNSVSPEILDGLTPGQKQATKIILGSKDQFIAIQGSAGVGKTTLLKAVVAALETLPSDLRPTIIGLAPTHTAVKEMRDIGVQAQTAKSFLVQHDQLLAAGETPDYKKTVFLIDESSMIGNQDTAAAYQAIRDGGGGGGGRAVSIGDNDQFEAVDSGAPFKLLQERSPIDVAIMKDIVRQRDMKLKSAVEDVIVNRIDSAIQKIDSIGPEKVPRINDVRTPQNSIVETKSPTEAIISDWMSRTPEARRNTLIITQLNADRRMINLGIHDALVASKELGEKSVEIEVLDKISHTRHQFNKAKEWSTGMTIKHGDKYKDVIAVDHNGSLITVRDEDGRIGLYSPKELLVQDVELFNRRELEIREGDFLRFTLSNKDAGQIANEKFTVAGIRENGELELKGQNGTRIINPSTVRYEQHIDYAWAVTGYGAQGASTEYVIALEGVDGGREVMAGKREFYINASRAKEHVQIYVDNLPGWLGKVKARETGIKTAHDALKPENQRQQARAIWAMGTPLTRTAIGRAWVRHNELQEHDLTARVLPATKKFPEPALALPVYDANAKTAGLVMVSLKADSSGHLTQGDTRMVITPAAEAAIVQRSRNGSTVLVESLEQAITAIKAEPEIGVIWKIGEDGGVSEHLVKLSRGRVQELDTQMASAVASELDIADNTAPVILDPEREGGWPHSEIVDLVLRHLDEKEQQAVNDSMAIKEPHKEEDLSIPADMLHHPNEGVILPEDSVKDVDDTAKVIENMEVSREYEQSVSIPAIPVVPESIEQVVDQRDAQRVARELQQQAEFALPVIKDDSQRTIEHDMPTHTRTVQKER